MTKTTICFLSVLSAALTAEACSALILQPTSFWIFLSEKRRIWRNSHRNEWKRRSLILLEGFLLYFVKWHENLYLNIWNIDQVQSTNISFSFLEEGSQISILCHYCKQSNTTSAEKDIYTTNRRKSRTDPVILPNMATQFKIPEMHLSAKMDAGWWRPWSCKSLPTLGV